MRTGRVNHGHAHARLDAGAVDDEDRVAVNHTLNDTCFELATTGIVAAAAALVVAHASKGNV
jgi:hypothetical protein